MTALPLDLAAGFALGLIYFRCVQWTARSFALGRYPWFAALLTVARFAVLACALAMAAMTGAGPLLAAAVGIRAARPVALRRAWGAPA